MVTMTRRVAGGYGRGRPAADRRTARGGGPEDGCRPQLDLGPASAYEALTRQMVEQVVGELDEIKGRLNGLLFLVAGAVILDTLARLLA